MTTYTASEETIRQLFLPYQDKWVELAISRPIAERKGIDSLFPEGYVKIVYKKALGLIDYDCEIDECTDEGLAWIPFSQIDDIRVITRPPSTEIASRRYRINARLRQQRGQQEPPHQEPPKQPPPAKSPADSWAAIGVSRGMSFPQVKAAYLEKIRLLHPDVNPGRADPEIAALLNRKAVELNRAFDELKRIYGQ